jgi:4-hydroxybenzoate polyprenyltransferase
MNRWWQLIRERFPLGSVVPMAVAFVLANAAIAAGVEGVGVAPDRLLAIGALALSFFFRLRLFDELKDHELDRSVHPDRPLARGLLGRREVGRVAAALAVVELALAAALGRWVLLIHAAAVGYSLLMYREFFVGPWLRPHLTLYAVVHTLVSALLGWSIAASVLGCAPWALPVPVLAFGGVNWMLFNVFEFARKTFAPAEERDGVPSYSKVFGIVGAGLLTSSQIAVALLILVAIAPHFPGVGLAGMPSALAALPFAAALAYAATPETEQARILRTVAGAYVVLFFAVVAGVASC